MLRLCFTSTGCAGKARILDALVFLCWGKVFSPHSYHGKKLAPNGGQLISGTKVAEMYKTQAMLYKLKNPRINQDACVKFPAQFGI
jgi:hypothetical protein